MTHKIIEQFFISFFETTAFSHLIRLSYLHVLKVHILEKDSTAGVHFWLPEKWLEKCSSWLTNAAQKHMKRGTAMNTHAHTQNVRTAGSQKTQYNLKHTNLIMVGKIQQASHTCSTEHLHTRDISSNQFQSCSSS